MALLDSLIDQINDDLKDCLNPIRWRFRLALSAIFDYSVANPTQGNASVAQAAIGSTFGGSYPDGLVSPGISIDTFTQVFINRHGVGANNNQKWVSVRDFIVQRADFKDRVLESFEEGTLLAVEELWIDRLSGRNYIKGIRQEPGTVVTETMDGLNRIVTYTNASLGVSFRETWTRVIDGPAKSHVVRTVERL